jgi:hypothetical protein
VFFTRVLYPKAAVTGRESGRDVFFVESGGVESGGIFPYFQTVTGFVPTFSLFVFLPRPWIQLAAVICCFRVGIAA